MRFISVLFVLFTLGVQVNEILAEVSADFDQVRSNAVGNEASRNNGVSSPEILEMFFKTRYTIPHFFFNKLKTVGREVSTLEMGGMNVTRIVAHNVANVLFASDGCHCDGYTCGCCGHLEEDEIHLNSTICVNVSYLPNDYGISFVMTLNEYVLYNETISVRNPPPVCIGMPFVEEFADVCARLYDVDATSTKLHACVRVEARLKHVLIAKYDLGCFDLGHLSELENFMPSVIRI